MEIKKELELAKEKFKKMYNKYIIRGGYNYGKQTISKH